MKAKSAILTSALGFLLACASAQAHMAKVGKNKQRCAGIVQAGKNDCSTSVHSCAGQGQKDGDPEEWVVVPKGLCTRIVGGKVLR